MNVFVAVTPEGIRAFEVTDVRMREDQMYFAKVPAEAGKVQIKAGVMEFTRKGTVYAIVPVSDSAVVDVPDDLAGDALRYAIEETGFVEPEVSTSEESEEDQADEEGFTEEPDISEDQDLDGLNED